MNEQLSIFDWMPELSEEPQVGADVIKHGAVIPHIMRQGYIGHKVAFDVSTQSCICYRIGILEAVRDDYYYKLTDSGYKLVPCDRVTIYTGKKQRSFISLMPGQEIFEVLPWDAYPKRMAAIGRRTN